MKTVLYLVAILTLLTTGNSLANEPTQPLSSTQPPIQSPEVKLVAPTTAAEKQVLLIGIGHNNKGRLNLLQQSLARFDIAISTQSAKGINHGQFIKLMAMYDLILLEGLNQVESQKAFNPYADIMAKDNSTAIVSLRDPKGKANANVTLKQAQVLADYYVNGGRKNFDNIGVFIAANIFSLSKDQLDETVYLPKTGYYYPAIKKSSAIGHEQSSIKKAVNSNSQIFFDLLGRQDKQPMIAITFHRAAIEADDMAVIDNLIARIESLGAKAYGVFEHSVETETSYLPLLMDPLARPDIIINYRSIHYAEKRKEEFIGLNIPVIQAINYQGTADEYHDDHSGISSTMTAFFLVMPETAGTVNPIVLAANSEQGRKATILEQLNALAERAVKHARLAHLGNSEKKLAVMVWNYPPGEHNIGAAYLNVPTSLKHTIDSLKQAGYTVNTTDEQFFIEGANLLLRPVYRKEDTSHLIEKGYADYLPLSVYKKWFATIPKQVQDSINQRWGTPSQNRLLTERDGEQYFIIPRMKLGNLIVLPKPSRSDGEDGKASLYHSMTIPVNHYYLAVYLYVTTYYGADAIIHFGTHGSGTCQPQMDS
ncbi:MAG: cobaltochelatase subunit CobN [Gammaproteobacteria bacterium]|nr:cobaltochelatase subunit CobN [Gammaproteobacteria bacterium]